MAFRLATVQFRPEKGRLEANLDKMAEAVRQSVAEGADLVLFPESAPTGYILEGGVEHLALPPQSLANELANRLQGLDQTVDVSTGFYEQSSGQPFNASLYCQIQNGQAQVLHVYRKLFLPTYHVFDEARFHQSGDQLGVVDSRLGKLGLLICEDVWHSILGSLLTIAGVHTVLVHAASPARGFAAEKPANLLRYEQMLPALAREHGLYVAMAMLTGFEGGKGFIGGSMAVSPFGEIEAQAATFGDEIILSTIDPDQSRQARQNNPLASDLKENWPLLQKIIAKLANE